MLPPGIRDLIDFFKLLPGVGPKTAERFAFSLLKLPTAQLQNFGQSLAKLKDCVTTCQECGLISEKSPCKICSNTQRDKKIICVVAASADYLALEKTGDFNGVYHVLDGLINHLENIGPEQLRIKQFFIRIKKELPTEVILALSATIEGETTAFYLANNLNRLGIKVSKLARGLPVGADIEYTDSTTLASALKNRIAA
jgi:recombination protein RecR